MLSISFFGATSTVTGAKFLAETGNARVLVECGLFQGLKELRLRNWEALPFAPQNLDATVLTHAHIDHSGYLPRLVKSGYAGPIVATNPTVDLCSILLPDSGELQEEEAFLANQQGYSKHSPALPLYTAEDAIMCLQAFSPVPYGCQQPLVEGVSLRMLDAGHILGSAIAELWLDDGSEQVKVVFSGDLGRYGGKILKDPTPIDAADYVVIESTYGDRCHPSQAPELALAEAVHRVVETRGIMLVPAFSVGRTQQILHALHNLEASQDIPILPVYVDSPMAIDATSVFVSYPDAHRLEFQKLEQQGNHPLRCGRLQFIRPAKESADLDNMTGPAIIISASGMATGGRVLNHLETYLPKPDALVVFVGYQAKGTRGRALLEGAVEVKIHGKMVPVRAESRMIHGFSSHGDKEDLLRWLGTLRQPPRKVFLVHGEHGSSLALAQAIRDRLGYATYLPSYGERVELSGSQ